MTNPHNVDICVTCVSEKPPQLPLREELPSLGIEVVYNARGVGAKASKQEQRNKLKEFQSKKKTKSKFSPGRFFFSGKDKHEERERQEEELKVPHALSYSSYQQKLESLNNGSSNESSHGTSTTSGSRPPISSLQFPTQSPEEKAVQEAFDVFKSDPSPPLAVESRNGHPERVQDLDDREPVSPVSTQTPAKELDEDHFEVASKHTASTLSSLQELAQRFLSKRATKEETKKKGQDSSSLASSRPSDEGRIPQPPSNGSMDEEADSSQRPEETNLPVLEPKIESDQPVLSSVSNTASNRTRSNEKHVLVSKVSQHDTISEFYDLTAISDEENTASITFHEEFDESGTYSSVNDLSTLSSKNDPTRAIHVYPSATIRQQLPGLRLQIPQEDDGYGRIVLDLSDVMEENGPGGPLVFSPSHEKTGSFDCPEDLTGYVDEWERNEGPREDEYGAALQQDYVANIGKTYAEKLASLAEMEDEDETMDYTAEPYRAERSSKPTSIPQPSSSLRKASSVEHPKLSVSFSHDVESRYYIDDEPMHSFDDVSALGHKRRQKVEAVNDLQSANDALYESTEAGESLPERFTFAENKEDNGVLDSGDRETLFLEALDSNSPLPANVEQILMRNPLIANRKLESTQTFPLHAACARPFDDKFDNGQPCVVEDLVNDIVLRKNLITALVRAKPEICTTIDEKGDLPVHIIARQMMEWEARWYQKVYENAKDESSEKSNNGAGITALYENMSQIIDILLRPIERKPEFCRHGGGVGHLLPLHIAAMFTVSYNTLKMLVEQYPQAAQHKCNLDEIRTFIPNFSIPLELHNRLSTDFPKWEIDGSRGDNEHEIQWTQSTLDQSYGTIGALRRSDLIFAYFPFVVPYRKELPRIRRFESRIRTEVEAMVRDSDVEMSEAVRLVWEWMCTFEGNDHDDHYADSVSRIVKHLSLKSIRELVSIPSLDSKPMIDHALPKCVDAVKRRLAEIANTEIPVPLSPLSTGFASHERSNILREYDVNMASRFCLQGRGFVGVVCRTLFNITETMFPTNFVFLPYKLVKDSEGRLGLDSAEAAATAMKFADSLLHLTDPNIILHFLEKKAVRFVGASLGIQSSSDWDTVEEQIKEHVVQLLSLYENKKAHFYFLDEYTGAPIVPEANESVYPLQVTEAADTVRKVLPMMLGGMILMRGEKALPIMAKVLLNENVKLVQEHWIEAAKDLAGYLYSPQTEWTQGFLQDLRPLRSQLVDFIEKGVSKNAPTPRHNDLTSEWVVECSLVKMIVEMHDPNHTMSGLRSRRAGLQVLWTREAAFLDPASNEHLMQVDFISLAELREQSEELEEGPAETDTDEENGEDECLGEGKQEPRQPKKSEDVYELLFRELALHGASETEESRWVENSAYKERGSPSLREGDASHSSSSSSHSSVKEDYGDLSSQLYEPTFVPEPPAIVRKRMPSSNEKKPISLIHFDEYDELNLDGVLQLRILLDEQEAKMEFLKEKVEDLRAGEVELHEEEERLEDLLDSVNNQKDELLNGLSTKGVTTARKLLLRICELEERVLCREVEVGQLKNDISCFELEAAEKREMDFLYDIL